MNPETLREVAAGLIAPLGLRGETRLEPLRGGANNRVFRLVVGDRTLLFKAYFQHRDDPRNRLESEYAFTTFAWQRGVRRVPQPLALDPVHGVALYEYVEGRPVAPGEVNEALVRQALDFYQELNGHRDRAEGAGLPVVQATEPPERFRWMKKKDLLMPVLEDAAVAGLASELGYSGESRDNWL